MYLYSRYHDIRDLQIRSLPGHVAIHYNGVDIEATDGTFRQHDPQKGDTLPAEEIVSINLLDTTDVYLSTHDVAAKDFLQASRLAFILSHERDIVAHNLDAAYGRLINSLMKRNNYRQALKFAIASRDIKLLNLVGHNGAVHEMEQHNYAAARRFAQHALKRDELTRNSWQSEGAYHYKAQRYHDAIKAFKHIDDQTFIRHCYQALFFEEQKKIGSDLTTDSIKKYAKTIKRMHAYAKKSGNKKLIKYASNLRKHL
jgi:tetratricopeptide (TPR) repeat protein